MAHDGPVAPAPANTIAPARACAYTVLRRVFEGGAYADQALHAESRGLDPRDRALAMRLAYGAVQRRGTLDHFIEQLADRPVDGLDAHVLAALRLGLYELLYLRGAPDYAVVGDCVELSKTHGRGGHGLVNAVLRRAAREGAPALLSSLSDGTPQDAAVMHSHPVWIARMWWDLLGAQRARELMAADNEPSELALRANTLVNDAQALAAALPVSTRADQRLDEALILQEPFDMHGSELWRAGAFIAQSRAAMHVSRALAPVPGERVLDLCAAPGNKSTHLAALMDGEGEVIAVERNPRRAGSLARNALRMKARNVHVEVADAAEPRSGARFDRVLVDPPCSGLGTLQMRADLRWRVSEEAVAAMAGTQARILAAGAGSVRPGGVLVYSTCTISPTENERLITAFLDSNADFSLEDLTSALPEFAAAETVRSGSLPGTLLTFPPRDGTAGFFISRLRRS